MTIRRAVTLSVGDELLAGETLDTHGRTIASALAARGCRVIGHRVLGDDVSDIASAIDSAASEADLVVVTGGLGPTLDDVSREALAEAMNERLVEDDDARAQLDRWYAGRGRVMPAGNVRQAMRPVSARCLENPNGTAPGLQARVGDALVVILPGPPKEMRPMLDGVLQAELIGGPRPSIVIRAFGIGESDAAERIESLMRRDAEFPVATTVSRSILSARIRGNQGDDLDAIESLAAQVEKAWQPFVFGRDEVTLPMALGMELARAGRTIATAESCTGGLVGAMLTEVPGSSAWYPGGWITYENTRKVEDLGVAAELIERDGAVSRSVVSAMADGARRAARADFGVSISGVAGPDGGSTDKPVGTVWIAVADDAGVDARCFRFSGDRSVVRDRAAKSALQLVRLRLRGDGAELLWQREVRS
ncbi:MAG: CinA family nicotinamide mononucleotide deamidase-related protein [Phycisphaerales bacterium]|nr:CinA family nicotinamide mononucleotide deamidase-related protein [Phycisphaerales bacterium]